jgi:thiol-disulfide isomerase/thioredoxin/tetratricopeptide (TPR) repeat protein
MRWTLLLLWLAAPGVVTAVDLPTVSLRPRPELLVVTVRPAEGTHLAADLPLSGTVEDGYFTFAINHAAPPPSGPATLRLPLVREKRIEAWTVTVQGAACADDGSTCVPFSVQATLGRGQLAATLETRPGRLRVPAPAPRPAAEPQRAAPVPGDLILMDFFATWCPPCDRLRDEFLESPQWAPFLSNYAVVSLDADDPSSFAAKDRYVVGGYPTLLLTTADGEVLERIVGFPGAEEVARRIGAASAQHEDDGSSCAGALPAVRRSVARNEVQEGWALLEARCPDGALADVAGGLLLGFEVAEAVGASELARDYAVAGASAEDDLGRAAWLAFEGATLLDEGGRTDEAAALRAATERRIDEALARPEPGPDLAIALADALYHRGRWSEDSAAWHLRAARLLGRAITDRAGAPPGDLPEAVVALGETLREHEGLVHDTVSLLRFAGEHDAVARLYDAMLALYPEAFTWHYARAGWLAERELWAEAEPSARAALDHAYGDMSLRASQRLAEVLVALGRPDEALAVLDRALATPEPTHQNVRTWRYRKGLLGLRDQLAPDGPR